MFIKVLLITSSFIVILTYILIKYLESIGQDLYDDHVRCLRQEEADRYGNRVVKVESMDDTTSLLRPSL
jgi:hypothetical protein